MARPDREAIDTFSSITGASSDIAIRKLEEHSGDLNAAINSYFADGDRVAANRVSSPNEDMMDIDSTNEETTMNTIAPILESSMRNPFAALDPLLKRTAFESYPRPTVSYPREMREIPIDFKEGNSSARDAVVIEEVTDSQQGQGPGIRGTVIIPDEDDEDDVSDAYLRGPRRANHAATAPNFDEFNNDIEEEMVKAAIEASKLEARSIQKDPILNGPIDEYESPDVDVRPVRRMKSSKGLTTGSSSTQDENIRGSETNGVSFPSHEWGGISSEEHDEAIMLEAAMFGGVPKGTEFKYGYVPHQQAPLSPTVQAQRDIREQQDDEYLASLAADREKELKAKQEAEALLLEEAKRNEEKQRKSEEEKALAKLLAEKESALPEEPQSDNEDAITLLVRMPDGSRRGRRFLKSNALQVLFDFIDTGRVVKPGSYRLVRPFPRRSFSVHDSSLTLTQLGFTGKQEALFLEFV